MTNLKDVFHSLPDDAKGALVNYYGSPDKVVQYFAVRFGTYAAEVMCSVDRRNKKMKPYDPIIGVNIATGKIHFNHVQEFYTFPWDTCNCRPGGHMEAIKADNNNCAESGASKMEQAV